MPSIQRSVRSSWVQLAMLAATSTSCLLFEACALPGPPRSWTPQSLAALPGETTCLENLSVRGGALVDESTLLMKTAEPEAYYLIKLDDNIQHLGSFDGLVVVPGAHPLGWTCSQNSARVYAWRGDLATWPLRVGGGIREYAGWSYGPPAPNTSYSAWRPVVAVRKLTPELAARYVGTTGDWHSCVPEATASGSAPTICRLTGFARSSTSNSANAKVQVKLRGKEVDRA